MMATTKQFSFTSIRAKITVMSVAAVLFLAVVGGVTTGNIYSLSKRSTEAVNSDAAMLDMVQIMTSARSKFQSQVQEWKDTLLRGNDDGLYKHHHDAFEQRNADVDQLLKDAGKLSQKSGLTDIVSQNAIDNLLKLHNDLHQRYMDALSHYNPAHPTAGQEVDKLVRGMDRPFTAALTNQVEILGNTATQQANLTKTQLNANANSSSLFAVITISLAIPLLALLGYFIARGIIRNLASFQGTVTRINEGDFEARAQIKTRDELGELAGAFNELLDNRVATLAQIQRDNEKLNESVITLLRSVAQLSKKDLTVKVPVSEDVTGAVSDALNLLSSETSKVLQEVSNISAEVTSASLKVQQQAESMVRASADDRVEVERAAQTLSAAAQSLNEIANLAQQCNSAADNAIRTTQMALSSVNNTVNGINSTRDVIRETEKRIKRLGERSQEISGAVNLINVIAERTHILALNASMHAASAGEAGRGFAVVADEVQRLAENSRQATQQIAALVNNIQVETSDTVNTMNDAITQIVEGSHLAEQAGQQMQLTQQTTADLVASVKQIATRSSEQAKAGQELVQHAEMLKTSSQNTSNQLNEQSGHTNSLVEYAKQLLMTVRVFKLPT
ncbi:MAG: methyl-accepting chemotaxis protein [Gallionella sp.]|nr:methyl-accepting chemotaxis protein [Gallionella sp.]